MVRRSRSSRSSGRTRRPCSPSFSVFPRATELNYDRIYPLLAWKGNDIVADATLHKNLGGWMKHVGTIRIVVAKDFHRKGMGSVLANELFLHALKSGLEKVVAEMMEAQPGAKRVFEKLGFKLEAT